MSIPSLRPGRLRLLGLCGAFVCVCGLLVAVALPRDAKIVEGPMIQLARPESLVLVWYANRSSSMVLTVGREGEERHIRVSPNRSGKFRASVGGLEPGTEYDYRIALEEETLFRGTFRSSRARGEPFSFLVFGDSGTGERAQLDLARRMGEYAPDFLVHTGDLVYQRGHREDFPRKFFLPYRHLLSRAAFWPCVGNHDVKPPGRGAAFREVFELPDNGPGVGGTGEDYWFDHGDARFVVVNTEHSRDVLERHVAPWIKRSFAPPSIRWRFAVLHRPPFASTQPPTRSKRVRAVLMPACEEARVDVVFAGHAHIYERTRPLSSGRTEMDGRGPVWVITGAGGGLLRSVLPAESRADWSAAVHSSDHSFTLVEIDGDELRLRQITRAGRTVDEWRLEKSDRH